MKKKLLFLGFLASALCGHSQNPIQNEEKIGPVSVEKAISFELTKPLRDFEPEIEQLIDGKTYTVNNKLRRYRHDNPNALPIGDDPIWQKQKESHYSRAPIQNWEGLNSSAQPLDPSGAAGPNHYVQAINTRLVVYNKTGVVQYGPTNLSTLLGGSNDGDQL
jgi:hypothetical protein